MKIYNNLIVFFGILLLFSCSPEPLPEVMNSEPVFKVAGSLNGSPVNLIAGINDYYHYTSFNKDEQDVYSFKGQFAKIPEDCANNCLEQLTISIRDIRATPNSTEVFINEAISARPYPYRSFSLDLPIDTITSYNVLFTNYSTNSDDVVDYAWSYPDPVNGDTTIITQGLNSVPDTLNVRNLGFPLTLSRANQPLIGSCPSYARIIGENNCSAGLTIRPTPFDTVEVSIADSSDLVNLSWLDGGGFGSPTLVIGGSGEYCSVSTFSGGCRDTVCVQIEVMNTFPLYCSLSYGYEVQPIRQIVEIPDDTLDLSKITIEYTDPNGIRFQSDTGTQPESSRFEVLEVLDFEENENGERVKQLQVRFNCLLFNEAGEAFEFAEGVATVGLAYPGS